MGWSAVGKAERTGWKPPRCVLVEGDSTKSPLPGFSTFCILLQLPCPLLLPLWVGELSTRMSKWRGGGGAAANLTKVISCCSSCLIVVVGSKWKLSQKSATMFLGFIYHNSFIYLLVTFVVCPTQQGCQFSTLATKITTLLQRLSVQQLFQAAAI